MSIISRNELLSLEQYHEKRSEIREELREHKALRRVAIGPHVQLFFEDKKTMQYQIQEMLYVEKIIDAKGIQEELDTYNPMIPEGKNWKATMMIEYTDEQERKQALQKLVNIENQVYVVIEGFEKIYAIADEDLDRTDSDKTSAVHFLRFQLDEARVKAIKVGAVFSFGIGHDCYTYVTAELPKPTYDSLLSDFSFG